MDKWSVIAQFIQIAILVGAFIYTYRQLKEAKNARKLQATREIINELGSEDVRRDRGWVLREMYPDDPTKLSSKCERRRAGRVAVAYDRVGFMVKQRLVDEDALFDFQQDEIKILWEKLKPAIKKEREDTKRPHHCTHFQYLYEKWLPRMEKKKKSLIERLWEKLEPIVKVERKDTDRPNHCKRFEYLFEKWLLRMKKCAEEKKRRRECENDC